jgi:capsular polysaccharide biosynthesis protein
MANQDEIELRWIFGVLRRWVWLILGCTALAGLAALFVTAQIAPVYEANVTLLVEPSKSTMSSEYSAIIAAERLALTYTQMLTSRPVMEAIIVELGLGETPDELAKKVSASSIRDTQLIKVTVKADSPGERQSWLIPWQTPLPSMFKAWLWSVIQAHWPTSRRKWMCC